MQFCRSASKPVSWRARIHGIFPAKQISCVHGKPGPCQGITYRRRWTNLGGILTHQSHFPFCIYSLWIPSSSFTIYIILLNLTTNLILISKYRSIYIPSRSNCILQLQKLLRTSYRRVSHISALRITGWKPLLSWMRSLKEIQASMVIDMMKSDLTTMGWQKRIYEGRQHQLTWKEMIMSTTSS